MHSRIGLDPQHYIGAYAFMLSHLYALAIETTPAAWRRPPPRSGPDGMSPP